MANVTQNYHETLDPPGGGADEATVTLATTYKGLILPSRYNYGPQYFNKVGRKLWIRMFGKITTALTPGNGQVGVLFGSGADNVGVNVVQSAAFALTASQANMSWWLDLWITCRSTGPAGTLFGQGFFRVNEAVNTATQQIPTSNAVVSAAVDLTQSLVPSVQFLRSGTTVETITVQDYLIAPMN